MKVGAQCFSTASPIAELKGRLCGEEEDGHKMQFTDFIWPKTPAFTRFYLLYLAFLIILRSKKCFKCQFLGSKTIVLCIGGNGRGYYPEKYSEPVYLVVVPGLKKKSL